MTIDESIFGLRFGSNEELSPSLEEINTFLRSPKKEGGNVLHGSDLSAYGDLLNRVLFYKQHQLQNVGPPDFREKIFYSALGHSCFFAPSLKLAIEQYKYHLHTLASLDFRKPSGFIRAAEEEMSGLNADRKSDAAKLARLHSMVDERKQALETLKKSRATLAAELVAITRYIRDNLNKIVTLCEVSLAALAEVQSSNSEENRLIQDVKTHFKEVLKDALHHGPLTKEYLETVKNDVDTLSRELSGIIREDVNTITRLYKAIDDHIKKYSAGLNELLTKIAEQKEISFDEEKKLFSQIEQQLVSLVSDHQFPVKTAAHHTDTSYADILTDKRKEMLDYLVDLLHRERRTRHERRSGQERRKFADPDYADPDRRSGKDRRSSHHRR